MAYFSRLSTLLIKRKSFPSYDCLFPLHTTAYYRSTHPHGKNALRPPRESPNKKGSSNFNAYMKNYSSHCIARTLQFLVSTSCDMTWDSPATPFRFKDCYLARNRHRHWQTSRSRSPTSPSRWEKFLTIIL